MHWVTHPEEILQYGCSRSRLVAYVHILLKAALSMWSILKPKKSDVT